MTMTTKSITTAYVNWLQVLVENDERFRSRYAGYRCLLLHLLDTQFTYILPMDGNRASDGEDLRYRFAYENGLDWRMVSSELDVSPCSVLEMMIALAIRCEDIMANSAYGDRTAKWFWDMVESLGLLYYDDDNYDKYDVERRIQIFLTGYYAPNGRGGLFTINGIGDIRGVEIWSQMLWYADYILKGEHLV